MIINKHKILLKILIFFKPSLTFTFLEHLLKPKFYVQGNSQNIEETIETFSLRFILCFNFLESKNIKLISLSTN